MRETSITPRGKDWERRQSGWLIPSALGLSGPALMFAGAKAKMNRWIAEGLGISAVQFGIPLVFGLSKITLALSLGGWLAAFIKSLAVRQEYLIRLDAVTNMIDNDLRQQIAHDYGPDPSRLGDSISGYIPPQNGSFVQTHDQSFGIKRNATPLMRGAPVHNNPKGYYNGERYTDEKNRRSRSVPPYTPPPPKPDTANKPEPADKFRAEPEIYEHTRLIQLDDFFKKRTKRSGANVYFYRISGYNSEIGRFIGSFCEAAEMRGIVIDSKLPPPDNEALLHYENVIGRGFSTAEDFFVRSMVNWLPKLEPVRRRRLARSVYNTINIMSARGLSETELRNSFIKFMCWIYRDFRLPVSHLGEEDLPKILCEGAPDLDELMMLNIISDAGCDVVLLLYDGEERYLAADPASEISDTLVIAGMRAFPEGYSLKALRAGRADELRRYREGRTFIYSACTNQWSSSGALESIAVPPAQRGGDHRRFYNIFMRVHGVADRGTYLRDLYDIYSGLKRSGRGVVAVSGSIPEPTNAESMKLRGGTYENAEQLISEMAAKIQYGLEPGLQWLMANSFTKIMKERASVCGLRELCSDGIHLVCWLTRYMTELFPAWQMPQVGAFILMGGCKTVQQAMFLRLLADLPTDVLILVPRYEMNCCLTDPRLMTEEHTDFLEADRFPTDPSMARVGTAAYHAERELDSLLYEDSGLYRDRQYKRANSITLKTMYEEIGIFWKEELKYRPNFSIDGDTVNMPVVFSKISGVKDGDIDEYWESIFYMMTPDTVLVSHAPYASRQNDPDLERSCRRFLDRGQLRKDVILNDPAFRYRYLRPETQEYMLDKLQQLLDSRVIRGTFAGSGKEFRVIEAVLGMDEYIVRMIQNFDFTKLNPKFIYIQSGESQASFEDAVMAAYLNLIGFDVAFFVPTGYQSVERFYATPMMEEHQAGEYLYDLSAPDLKSFIPRSGFEKRFRKRKK